MSMSLRDQLLAAGLGTKKQAKDATQGQRPRSRHEPPKPTAEQLAAQQAQAAKLARDQELNRQRQEKAAAKARRAQLQQLIDNCRLAPIESEEYFNFVDGSKLARIPVNTPLREQLVRGSLVIVRYGTAYALVPRESVERIRERDAAAVVFDSSAAPAADKDDPYKDHVVPDDLMW